jgi:hypothetical protein
VDHQNGGTIAWAFWQQRFVVAVWATATALALVATALHGRWLPWSDDFDMVPFVTGDKPITLGWLWEQHNEHRIPLVKLFFVGLGRLSGCDYRWTLATNALLLSFTAGVMLVAARRLRGSSSWTDAMFPVLLLHLGQGTLVWAFHTQMLLTTFLGGIFIATAVAAPRGSAWRAAIMVFAACLLPLTGSSGLVVAAAAACLLMAEAVGWNSAGSTPMRFARGLEAAGACMIALLAVAYVASLHLTHAATYAGVWQTLVASLDTLTSYAGGLVNRSPAAWRLATAGAIIGTVALAVRGVLTSTGIVRSQLMILLGYLAALGMVAVAIGHGRGTRDFTDLYGHYATLAVGVPVAMGLIWAALPQTRAARVVQAALCVAAIVIAFKHAKAVVRTWGSSAEEWAVLTTAMRGELSPEEVAARHARTLFFVDTPDTRHTIAVAIASLRRTTFPIYCTRQSAPGGDRTGSATESEPRENPAVPGATGGTGDIEAE